MTNTFTYLTSSSVSVAAADQQTKEWLYSNKVVLAYFLHYCHHHNHHNHDGLWSLWNCIS